MSLPTITDVIKLCALEDVEVDVLIARLTQREDAIADLLREAGMQFGLEPAIVAEVLAEVGVGTPLSTEERTLIHNAFHQTMERLRREFGGGNG